ncbi:MAG: DUF4270 domain-containing protein [Lentimicrobiaceae bacterium]|nr:DUF4270 domain-containing protein [Lentimicrobiaceae bacterium]
MKNFWKLLRENFNSRTFYGFTLALPISLLLFFQACQNDPSSIGLNLQDRDDLLNAVFTDTITLTAHSILEDTLNTRNLEANFLGFIRDPVFGQTYAGIFTQLIPSGSSVNFGKSPQLDSIVLTLRYAGGFYGDTLNPFVVQVHRLTEDILSEKDYYQNSSFAHSSDDLTYKDNFLLYPKPTSKVKLDTILEPHLRIRLDDELGNLLLSNADKMSSNAVFKDFFKGLYICAKSLSNDGSLVNFDLASAMSGVQLYYKDDTIARRFHLITRSTVRVGHYEHDYEAGDSKFVSQLLYNDTLLGKEILYVQCMGGVKTKVTFPHIKAFRDKNVVINKAELVVTNIGENLSFFPPPKSFYVYRINNKGDQDFVVDYNTVYWGGAYNETTKEYRFRITRYLQDIIFRDEYEPYVYLVPYKNAASANRLIFSGTQPHDPSLRLRVEVYYTEY